MILSSSAKLFSDDCACYFNLMCHVIFLHSLQHSCDNWIQMKIQRKNVCFSFHCNEQNSFIDADDSLKTCVLLLFQLHHDFNFDWFQQWKELLMRLMSCYNFVNESWFYHCWIHLLNLNQEKISDKFCDFKQSIDLTFYFLHDFIQMTVSVEL